MESNNNTNSNTNAARAAAQSTIDARIVESTKSQYGSKVKRMEKWFKTNSYRFKLPLKSKCVIDYFGSLIVPQEDNKQQPSISTIASHKSALMWHYKENNHIIDPLLKEELEKFLHGYKRIVSGKKLSGEMQAFEGKHYLSFNGYQLLANKFLKLSPTDSNHNFNQMLFSWPFLIFQWNLMARGGSTAKILLQHISWRDDSLVINIPKHKGDQEGSKCFPRHVFANPLQPSICPVLSLAVNIFSKAYRYDPEETYNYRLFDGDDQERRFSKLLGKVLSELNENELNQLGAKAKDIGTHSARKGAPTFCSGMICGPSPVQIFLRAGWSLGGVQDRYLFSGSGGDQFTGRVVSGLPNTCSDFSTLPPHFITEVNISLSEWEEILPSYSRFSPHFKQVIIYLLASLIYHEKWLRDNLPNNHPLFSSFLFSSNKIRSFSGFVSIKSDKLRPTGIPPHLTISNELATVASNINQFKEEILSQCLQLPKSLTETLLAKFEINGAIPVTMDALSEYMNKIVKELKQSIGTINQTTPITNSDTNLAPPKFNFFSWGLPGQQAKLHMVPEKWTLPTTNMKNIWNLWWFGHLTDKIQPYRFLQRDDLVKQSQYTQLSKLKRVINSIELIARNKQFIEQDKQFSDLNKQQSNEIFEKSFTELLKQLYTTETTGRIAELSFATIYDRINNKNNNNKRKRDEEEEKQPIVVNMEL